MYFILCYSLFTHCLLLSLIYNSGLYPMYKFGADFMGKSCARVSVHITDDEIAVTGLNSRKNESLDESYPHPSDSEEFSIEISTEDSSEIAQLKKAVAESHDTRKNTDAVNIVGDVSGKQCRIIIEEALHLPVEITPQGTG